MIQDNDNITIEKKPFLVNLAWASAAIATIIMMTWAVASDRRDVGRDISNLQHDQKNMATRMGRISDDASRALHESDLIKRDIQDIKSGNTDIKESIKRLEEHLIPNKRRGAD